MLLFPVLGAPSLYGFSDKTSQVVVITIEAHPRRGAQAGQSVLSVDDKELLAALPSSK